MATHLLNSLDGNENVISNLDRPDRYRHLFESLSSEKKVVARGSALSYCNASAAENTNSVSSLLFNRILFFDKENGIITVEPGVKIGDLIRFSVAHNFYLPVSPGHPAITIGGCVAFNVHGKSQYKNGNFIEFVNSLMLFHPDHGEVTCSRDQNTELFYLTVGGFGLTGFITQIDIRLVPLIHKSITREQHKSKNLIDAVEQMRTFSASYDAVYGWSNLNKKGDLFGEGIVYAEKFSDQDVSDIDIPDAYELPKPSSRKFSLYNNFTNAIICKGFQIRESLKSNPETVAFQKAIFPLYGHDFYFSLFGKTGLREYSMLFSFEAWPAVVENLEKISSTANIPLTLTTMRLLTGKQTLLNYCSEGVGINIDVPATNKSLDYFKALDELVIKHKGFVNLSKDSRMTHPTVREIFPEYDLFKQKLLNFDPARKFDSALRKRIDV